MKRFLIIVAMIGVLVAMAFIYLNHRNRTLSPAGETKIEVNGCEFAVYYSRPSVRERVLFGPKDSEALQPYGEYWRFGANESTEIEFGCPVEIEGKSIRANRFKMYCIPSEEFFTLYLNAELGTWGYSEPDHEQDIFSIQVPITSDNENVEQFTLELVPATEKQFNLVFMWGSYHGVLPINIIE